MKTGTSYLQRRMHVNQGLLADRGVLFPGEAWRDQVLAVSDVLGRKQAGPAAIGRWASLVQQIEAYDGDVLVSMEFLGPARRDKVVDVVRSFEHTPVEVVATLRDLGRAVPAMWQESLQNGGTRRWGEYVDALHGKTDVARAFWRQQGMGRIVDNWAQAVGPGRATLVTVPPPGAESGLLWSRFLEATGVDGAGAVDVPPVNTSLDAASAQILRELNARLDGRLSASQYRDLVKFGLAKRVLAARQGPQIGFDPPGWLVERSEVMVSRLAASGARVVGDLTDLAPVTVPGTNPEDVPESELVSACLDALQGSTLRQARPRRSVR
jgi:hypothetical protein